MFDLEHEDTIVNSATKKGYSISRKKSYFSSTCEYIDTIETHYGDIVLLNVYFPNGQKDEVDRYR